MKRIVCSFLIASMAVCGAQVMRARAQDDEPEHHGPGMQRPWAQGLGLSKDQRSKLEAAKKAQWDASRSLRRELRDAMTRLHDQVEDKASDKDIEATLDRVKAAHKALQAQMEKFHDTAAGILTPSQRAKMVLSRGHRMRMMGMMMGHGGPMGGPGMRPGGRGHHGWGGPHKDKDEDGDEGEEHEAPEHASE